MRKEKIQYLFKGADTDTDIEIKSLENGVYISSVNMRATSKGTENARTKIGGSILVDDYAQTLSDNGLDITGLKCIGAIRVEDKNIVVLADDTESCICIDNHVVVYGSDLRFREDYPVQIIATVNGDNINLFMNDRQTPPLILDLNDVITNAGDHVPEASGGTQTTKYFTDFDICDHTPQLNAPTNRPTFKSLEPALANGLPSGKYAYQIQYVSNDGSKTAFSLPTQYIPVPEHVDNVNDIYSEIHSNEISVGRMVGQNTNYGIRIRIRISNKWEYDYIRIKRTVYRDGQGFDNPPTTETHNLSEYNIKERPYGTYDFVDDNSVQWSAHDETEEDANIIEKAQAIRYYKDRLIIMNPTYCSHELDTTDLFLDQGGKLAWPVIEDLSYKGHHDIGNQVNYLSLMRGERYGWYVIGIDSVGGKTFAVPVKNGDTEGVNDFTNYQMPNRREEISTDTDDAGDSVDTADVDSGGGASVSSTHEVFEEDPVDRSTLGFQPVISVNSAENYNPFTPTGDGGAHHNHEYDKYGYWLCPITNVDSQAYAPQGFRNKYFSMGMQFKGLDITKLPDQTRSFSIVRTRPAGRVVCQGLAGYSLTERSTVNAAYKDTSKVWFYSPDIDPVFGSNPDIFTDILENPTDYQVQLVSPLGFFSEPFSEGLIDLLCQTFQYEDETHNPGDVAANIGRGDGYVSFGRWRNTSAASGVESSTDQFIYDVTAAAQNEFSLRHGVLKLTLGTAIYASAGNNDQDGTDADVKNWHEPVYVVNIIKNELNADSDGVINCVDTYHIQHLESVIGLSTHSKERFLLVDERPEDCIAQGSNNGYVYVDGKAWLTNIPTGDYATIMTALTSNGVYNDGYKDIYGVCRGYQTRRGGALDTYISFNMDYFNETYGGSYNSQFYHPPEGSVISVKYDARQPISVFGGDTYIGRVLAPMIDLDMELNETVANNKANCFKLLKGFPFHDIVFSAYYDRAGSSYGTWTLGTVATSIDYIRQLAMEFVCESRMNIPMLYNDSWPRKNYVIRPNEITTTNWEGATELEILADANVHQYYADDYKDEYTMWSWGGFHFPMAKNADYGKQWRSRYFTQPAVGFTERLNFPNYILWSNERNQPGVVNALKSFPVTNQYKISDRYGDIMYAFDASSEKGSNLYAICQYGVVVLITEKDLLYLYGGEELGLVGADQFMKAQYFIPNGESTRYGVDYDNWKTIAEFGDSLFFANSDGVYKLYNNQIQPIENNYYKELDQQVLQYLKGNTDDVKAVVDHKHKEYWLYIKQPGIEPRTYVYDIERNSWAGYYTYQGQLFWSDKHDVYTIVATEGYLPPQSRKLNAGLDYSYGGNPAEIKLAILAEPGVEVDYNTVKIFGDKPTKVEFSRTETALPEVTLSATKGIYYLKKYGPSHWQNRIPAMSDGKLMQSRVIIIRVQHVEFSAYTIKAVGVKYNRLRQQ